MFIRMLKSLFSRTQTTRSADSRVDGYEEMASVRKDTKGGRIGEIWDGGLGKYSA